MLLSKLYKAQGDLQKSIQVLRNNGSYRCFAEFKEEAIDVFEESARLKLEESLIQIEIPQTLEFANQIIELEHKLSIANKPSIIVSLGKDRVEMLFEQLKEVLVEKNMLGDCKEFLSNILKLSVFSETDKRINLKKELTKVSIKDQDYQQAINSYKYICEKENSQENWSVLSCLLQKCPQAQIRPWLNKLCNKFVNHERVSLLLANNYLQNGYYSLAIKHYTSIYPQNATDPLLNLNLGLSYLFSLSSRNLTKKEEYFLLAFEHIKTYVRFRKKTHYAEAYFNLARAYQHIKFLSKAAYYYEKLLRTYLSLNVKSSSYSKYATKAGHNLYLITNELWI